MRLISTLAAATLFFCGAIPGAAPGAAQAHTVSSGAQAASGLLMLLAYAHPNWQARTAIHGDLSRSPGQIRRLALQAHDPRR